MTKVCPRLHAANRERNAHSRAQWHVLVTAWPAVKKTQKKFSGAVQLTASKHHDHWSMNTSQLASAKQWHKGITHVINTAHTSCIHIATTSGATFSKLLRKIFGRFIFLGKHAHFWNSFGKQLWKILGKGAFSELLWKDLWKKLGKYVAKH